MRIGNRRIGGFAAGLIGMSGIFQPVSAELPTLAETKWLGYFVGYQNKKFQFGISSQGKATIKVIGKKGEPLNQMLAIPVEFLVEEVLPEGKTQIKSIKPESLESAQPATEKPQGLVFKGKVTGDASFEVFVTEASGGISLGGRLLDPGTVAKNPLRFSIRLKFPDAYPNDKKAGDKKLVKAFEDKIKNDRLQLAWTDGKRVKQAIDKPVDAGSKEINGPGIAAAQLEFSSYDAKRFEFIASPGSSMTLSSTQAAPLHEGFSLTWTADPAKDPAGKARLGIEIK